MGSLVLRSLLVVVAVLEFGCSALEGTSQLDPDITQREVTFDLEDLWEHIELPEADPDVTQREVTIDLPKILRERGSRRGEPDMTQRMVDPVLDGHFEEIDRPMLFPRSFEPKLPFPPARPYLHNFPAICHHGEGRHKYSRSSFPQDRFTHLQRQGDAIGNVESLYSFCCEKNGTLGSELSLCCAQQAWEHALNNFCDEEFSIKTNHYHCCRKRSVARWSCFEKGAPNKSYQPTNRFYQPTSKGSVAPKSPSESEFNWNPDNCQRTDLEPREFREDPKVPDIRFPPGRPTSSNIRMICDLHKIRPRYDLKCLPSDRYGWLARQSKAINRLEKGIKQCCKGQDEVLACADGKWQAEMDRYCKEERSVKSSVFSCCDMPKGQDRYSCISESAPDSTYTYEILQRPIDSVFFVKLDLVCDTHKLLAKKFPVPFPVKGLVSQCCHLPAAQRTACVQGELDDLMERMCTEKEPLPPTVSPDCCLQTSPPVANCLFKLLEDALIKAKRYSRIKRKCPLV
ncbi:extracellular matrix protein 1 [Anguilla rostrata]